MDEYQVDKKNTITHINTGKTIFFGPEDFMKRIVSGKSCFICGAIEGTKDFNYEHIIPDWILRRYRLHHRQFTLPNGTFIKYHQYTVPCCQDCNSALGKIVEKPISNLLKKSFNEAKSILRKDNTLFQTIFKWMCLIYFKVHLKDMRLPLDRDVRKDTGNIGDNYDWTDMHHIHCMARSHYTGAIIEESVYGTVVFLHVLNIPDEQPFDYIDNLQGRTVLIQVGEICIIAVLNDSTACLLPYLPYLKKITGPLTPVQTREIFAYMAYVNINLKERPEYRSTITEEGYEIQATVPSDFELCKKKVQKNTFEDLLHYYVGPLIPKGVPNRGQILQEIKEGKRRFIFNGKGEFVQYR